MAFVGLTDPDELDLVAVSFDQFDLERVAVAIQREIARLEFPDGHSAGETNNSLVTGDEYVKGLVAVEAGHRTGLLSDAAQTGGTVPGPNAVRFTCFDGPAETFPVEGAGRTDLAEHADVVLHRALPGREEQVLVHAGTVRSGPVGNVHGTCG